MERVLSHSTYHTLAALIADIHSSDGDRTFGRAVSGGAPQPVGRVSTDRRLGLTAQQRMYVCIVIESGWCCFPRVGTVTGLTHGSASQLSG